MYEPWQVLTYLSAALMAGIVVSLLTRPTEESRLQRFYALTRTPIGENETISEPCTLPTGVEPAQREMLCTALGLEVPKPSRESVVGFVIGWLCVFGLIGGFVWLIS